MAACCETQSYNRETAIYTDETAVCSSETGSYNDETAVYNRETVTDISETVTDISETGIYINETGIYLSETAIYNRETGISTDATILFCHCGPYGMGELNLSTRYWAAFSRRAVAERLKRVNSSSTSIFHMVHPCVNVRCLS